MAKVHGTAVLPDINEQREIASAASRGRQFGYDNPTNSRVNQPVQVQFADGEDPGKQIGRAQDPAYEAQLQSIRMRHEATGVQPATILNFSPLELHVNSPMADIGYITIPPCPADEEFSSFTWRYPAIEQQNLEGRNSPLDFQPIQLAQAFEREYQYQGGVVAIIGFPSPDVLEKNREKINASKATMIRFLLSKVTEANGHWNSAGHQDSKYIVDIHRAAATKLKELGVIKDLPPWIQPVENLSAPEPVRCQACASIPDSPGASICTRCGHVIDPARAYIAGTITEDSPALERLTREQVKELGISDYVAETVDEKPKRLASRKPKPMSVAMQELASQEAEA